MTMQLAEKKSIQEQIFNEETILRASMMYRRHMNVHLDKLHQEIITGNETNISSIKSELNSLRKNLEELEDANHTGVIKLRINVATPKNVAKALSFYYYYIDVYLDLLSSAIKAKDTEKVDEVKVHLGNFQKNIWKLEMLYN